MRSCLRLFVCAFVTDASLYLAFAALPFRAMELGAGPARIGILPTLYAAAYFLSANAAKNISRPIQCAAGHRKTMCSSSGTNPDSIRPSRSSEARPQGMSFAGR